MHLIIVGLTADYLGLVNKFILTWMWTASTECKFEEEKIPPPGHM